MTSTMPTLLSAKTGRVLVRPSLQVDDANHLNVFSLGDIAECKGPKMGRSAMSQADLVALNIVAMISGSKLRDYEPEPIDGMLKLSLGLVSFWASDSFNNFSNSGTKS
jgi:apoptosis-inducing factor 2